MATVIHPVKGWLGSLTALLLIGLGSAGAAENNPFEAGVKAVRNRDWRRAADRFGEAISMNLRPFDAHIRRGGAFYELRDYRQALVEFDAAAGLKPDDPFIPQAKAQTREKMHDYAGAAREYERAIHLKGTNHVLHNNLAWILATCADASVRDGRRAVVEADTAVRLTQGKSAYCLDTLAAAYAECGQFGEAIQRETEAVALLRQPGQNSGHNARDYLRHSDLYRHNQPFRLEP